MKKISILFVLAIGLSAVGAQAKIATNGENLNGTSLTGGPSTGVVNGIRLAR